MKRCEKCGVRVAGTRTYCPLCQNLLSGSPDPEEPYPHIPPTYSRYKLFWRAALFLSVCAGVLALFINYLLPEHGFWSLAVLLGLLCLWVMLNGILRRSARAQRTILNQVLLTSLVAVLWDAYAGWYGWSVNYVLPCVCIAAILAMYMIGKVLRMPLVDYLYFVFLNCLFGLLPLVLLLIGVTQVRFPSLVCTVLSILSIAGLVIFQGKNMGAELRKKMHL